MLILLPLACLSPSDLLSGPLGGASAEARGVTPLSQNGLLETERNSVDVFAQAAPSTVFVTQSQLVRRWGASDPVEVPAGTGTGVIWDTQGHVVTNFHVVDGASSLEVALHDGSTWPARFIGGEPRKDIAVLQIDAPKDLLAAAVLPPVGAGLQVGQKVLAIGNPYGLDHTLTVGVVSAIDREILGYGGVSIRGVIQTDASINPGNSGGPLLNSKGQLIGINSQIASASGASAGIGFAVPVDTVRRVVSEVVEFGQVQQAGMGVRLVDDRLARRAGIPAGVVLRSVVAGSPAEEAGLIGLQDDGRVPGDIVVGVNGESVTDYDDLYNALDGRKAGEEVTLQVLRNGETREVILALILLE